MKSWPKLVATPLMLICLLAATWCGSAGCRQASPEDDAANATALKERAPSSDAIESSTGGAKTPEVAPAGISREQTLLASLTILVLAMFVGFEVITKVPPTLHTPLMSGSNAISGITIVGAALMAGNDQSGWAMFFGLLAVIMATINVIGGFMVTDRMLGMFKRKS